ncbi:MAG: hypothetical protein IPO40_20425 [Fibrobacteres bacterium]|nr:hypothetical protein [Fibrobacterota bacterium]
MKIMEPNQALETHLIQIVKEFAIKMNELEIRIFETKDNHRANGVDIFEEFRKEYNPIFLRYATGKKRVYGGKANSFGKPTRYDGIMVETDGQATLKSKTKAEVYFKTKNSFAAEYLFVLQKEDDEWRIDNVKHKRYNNEKWNKHIM